MADPVSLAITAALTAAQMALTATQKIEGPRLDDLSVTVADYGTPLNYFYGTRRFEGVPIIFAEPLREVKKRRKTKGGKYNEYTYYGTWAIAIAGHEIDGVTRIWFDKHLVYDATGAGPISPFSLKKGFGIAEHIRFYLGTETQTADPRMLATVEAEHGAGSCPAYRGTAYAVFEEIPLEKLGNRIPQITIEAVAHGTPHYPYEVRETETDKPFRPDTFGSTFAADYSRFFWSSGGYYEVFDVAARQVISYGEIATDVDASPNGIGVSSLGVVYMDDGAGNVAIISSDSAAYLGTIDAVWVDGCTVVQLTTGAEYLCCYQAPTATYIQTMPLTSGSFGLSSIRTDTDLGDAWTPSSYVADSHGSLWAVGVPQGVYSTATEVFFYRVVMGVGQDGTPEYGTLSGVSGLGSISYVDCTYSPAGDHFVLNAGGQLVAVDPITFTEKHAVSFTENAFATTTQFRIKSADADTLWLGTSEYDLDTLDIIRTIDIADWGHLNWSGPLYDPINHALITTPNVLGANELYWNYLDRLGSDGVALGDIAEDVAERCALPAGGYSFADLDQIITGYNWTQGSGRDILDPLFSAYDSDIAPHDFTIRGVKRGASSSGTIDVAQFVRDPERYQVSITQDADLPRALTFSFADTGAEQQTNSVLVQRPSVAIDGVRELNINMTSLALSVDDARELAERYFRRIWFGREKVENVVTAQYLSLEPSDVKTLTFDGISRTARLLEQTLTAGGTIKAKWERDAASIALLSGAAGAAMDGRAPSVMLVPGLTRGFVLDVPLSSDIADQSNPFMLIAAGPYSSTGYWSGADVYMSDDGSIDSYDAGWAAVGPLDACTWGFTTDALGDGLPWVRDDGNSLNVRLRMGDLETVSDAEFDASASLNMALVESGDGWEYIRFRTATLEGDGSYTLTGLMRGCRGTEQYIDGHAIGDSFLLVDASVSKRGMSAGEIGDTDYYKSVSQGRDESSAYPQTVAFSASAQKPYSPVHGELTLDGSGDWSIDAVRRSRIGGANIDGSDVPLGETSESWSCDIMDGADVVRTITGPSLPLAYSSADQTTDFGSPQTSLTVNLYQVSPSLSLRGFGLEITA